MPTIVAQLARRPLASLALLCLAATCLSACAAPADAGAPEDLVVSYQWREGSLPPPYHYSYSIKLQADGAGELTMIPDYPGAAVPEWTEPFQVARAELDQLYTTMVAEGLLREGWREQADPPVGGSSEDLIVVAGGRSIMIPAFLPPAQREHAEVIYTAIRALVPAELFADLEARRAAYVAEQGGTP